jgi:tight adherence protein C
MPIYLLAAVPVFLALAVLVGIALLHQLRREKAFAARVALAHGETPTGEEGAEGAALRTWLTKAVTAIGQAILRTGMLSSRTRTELERTLDACGLRGPNGLGLFIGFKILLLVGLPIATMLALDGVNVAPRMHVMLPAGAAVIGLLAPDWVIGKRRQKVMAQLEQGLPDALDMMVICAQAGLGLGPGIIRVADEMKHSYRDLSIEFSLTANELQILSDTRIALHNLGHRSGLEAFRRLAMTLIQTIQYGTPLTDALRTLSAEMRQEALTKFEESAARLPTMLTMPMIIFILPCVFLIAGGPAIIQVMHAMG